MNVCLILGNQLFDPEIFKKHIKAKDINNIIFFMKEDRELASYYKFHKHKILFFFSAMRTYRDELISLGYRVHYEEFQKIASPSKENNYEKSLGDFMNKNKITNAFTFEIEDKFFEKRMIDFFFKKEVCLTIWQTPMFLTDRELFKNFLNNTRKPLMKNFYEAQRKRLKILVTDNKPLGGTWSFDTENRLALPKNKKTPSLPTFKKSATVLEVAGIVDENFSDHIGHTDDFWLPVSRSEAKKWLKSFLSERLYEFGPYEDAIPLHSEFLYHSILTPYLNCGLLTPEEVIKETLLYSEKNKIPLASLEGFIRQIIGWREFIRGIYQNFSEKQESANFWNHKNKLSPAWYEGDTGIPPLDETLRRVIKRGYAHHIERLMILGNLMLLLEVEPKEAHRWFMELFIDSSDWVMGPNVYGMALFSDGGLFATKPYICGSNYLRKMGGYPKDDWCDGVDGLYWQFIKKHEHFFLKNPRLSMMVRTCHKITKERWEILNQAAENMKIKLVIN
jgi:deoxyribodipyrimidine photolyase-related protein